MGYASTLIVILLGVSFAFYFYSGYINDPITQEYGMDAEHAANMSAQMNAPLDAMTAQGTTSQGTSASNVIMNLIYGIIAGVGIAGAASLLYGGSFATMYMIPAGAIGGIIAFLTTPIDAINQILGAGNMPEGVGILFMGFMMTGLLLVILSFIFGGDRV